MRSFLLLGLTGLSAFATAQVANIPVCAAACLYKAVSNSPCGMTDYYCQCTSGAAKISENATPCLCSSSCTPAELFQVVSNSNNICTSALAAKSETFTPTSVATDACATVSATSSGTGKVASVSATATASASASASSKATASQSVATSPTSGADSLTMYEGMAALGLAGGFAAWVLVVM